MNVRISICVALLLAASHASPAWARGGGGCIEEGTGILTPSGTVAIERLSVGDEVLCIQDGKLGRATVRAVTPVEPEEFLELVAGGRKLRLTATHPIALGKDVFRLAGRLKAGDEVLLSDGLSVSVQEIQDVRRVQATRPARDLLVSPGGTYVANGFVVHNKGCFLGDTPVLRADGSPMLISQVRQGDVLRAFDLDGRIVNAQVQQVTSLEAQQYFALATEHVVLRVTAEHPFYVGEGTFKTVRALSVGENILAYDGSGLRPQRIVSKELVQGPIRVFNLQTGQPHTFFAAGIAVHNKGGGGGGGSHGGGGFHGGASHGSGTRSGSGSSPAWLPFVFIGGIVLICVVRGLLRKAGSRQENLDYSFSQGQVNHKADKTRKLLEFIARTDPSFNPQVLEQTGRTTFVKLQECWQSRDYSPMQPLMMAGLYAQHLAQIQAMINEHETNVIGDLAVEQVTVVNVRYTHKIDDREFTALIAARARDYYVDDRTGGFLRGDDSPQAFQEFWTFQLQGGKWLLREIEQTRESDVLKEENFFEPFTDRGLGEVYGDSAGKSGAAGPWLEKQTAEKSVRIDRLLNFLVQTDKLWDRQGMLDRARKVFMDVYLSQQGAEPAAVSADEVFPDLATSLSQTIRQRRQQGYAVEYRNLCVRKVELILVRNFADNSKDEFTARICAHAQRIISRNGVAVDSQEYVEPFTEYWTLGRMDGQWKLKEVLPEAKGRQVVGQENLDEGSTARQLQWFYRQPRAG